MKAQLVIVPCLDSDALAQAKRSELDLSREHA